MGRAERVGWPTPMKYSPHRRLSLGLVLLVGACGGAPAAPTPAEPAREGPLLRVVLPAEAASGTPSAKAIFKLYDDGLGRSHHRGIQLSVGGGKARVVPVGEQVELAVPARTDGLYRFEVDGLAVLS